MAGWELWQGGNRIGHHVRGYVRALFFSRCLVGCDRVGTVGWEPDWPSRKGMCEGPFFFKVFGRVGGRVTTHRSGTPSPLHSREDTKHLRFYQGPIKSLQWRPRIDLGPLPHGASQMLLRYRHHYHAVGSHCMSYFSSN